MNTNLISEMEEYAKINNVPIMIKDTLFYIDDMIKKEEYKSVLEIGTAIAYSSIYLRNNNDIKVTSIERDIERYNIAVSNVKKSNLSDINLIYGDALMVDIKDKYDLIIIDAAKSQNIKFFEKYKNNLNDNGAIIVDNMLFHGFVGKSSTIKSRNLRGLVRKLEAFHEYIDNQNEYSVKHVDIGDGIIVCKKNI